MSLTVVDGVIKCSYRDAIVQSPIQWIGFYGLQYPQWLVFDAEKLGAYIYKPAAILI